MIRALYGEELAEFWALRQLASPRVAGWEQDELELGSRVAFEFAWSDLFSEAWQ